jgi:hypothetical protein
MNQSIGMYAKSIVVIIAAGVGILASALSDNRVSEIEALNIGLAVLNAVLVYGLANLPEGPRKVTKSLVTVGIAVLQALVPLIASAGDFAHVNSGDYLFAMLTGLASVGVYVIPNTKPLSSATQVSTTF